MALSFNDFVQGMGQGHSGDYRQGLGKKTCCTSCTHGGPCTGCGGPAGSPCRCKGGLGATTVFGSGDLEPGDYGYKQTARPGQTVAGARQGLAPVARRIALTNMINELEFLAGTPGVHPRVLAQKVWLARKALMGTSRWQFASYKSPSSAYDSYGALASRLGSVERVLGTAGVSSKLMASGGLGGYGNTGAYTGAPWGATGGDPITKLASCIRGMLCMPKAFCCPSGQKFEDPYYDEFPEFDDEFPEDFDQDFYSQGGDPGGTQIGEKGGTRIGDKFPPKKDPPPWLPPPKKGRLIKMGQDLPPAKPKPRRPRTGGNITYGPKLVSMPGGGGGAKPKPKPPRVVTGGNVIYGQPKTTPLQTAGGTKTWAQNVAQTDYAAIKARAIANSPQARQARGGVATGGAVASGGNLVSMGGLGGLRGAPRQSQAMNRLVAQLRVARAQARRSR